LFFIGWTINLHALSSLALSLVPLKFTFIYDKRSPRFCNQALTGIPYLMTVVVQALLETDHPNVKLKTGLAGDQGVIGLIVSRLAGSR
jgi:hypothetical protein